MSNVTFPTGVLTDIEKSHVSMEHVRNAYTWLVNNYQISPQELLVDSTSVYMTKLFPALLGTTPPTTGIDTPGPIEMKELWVAMHIHNLLPRRFITVYDRIEMGPPPGGLNTVPDTASLPQENADMTCENFYKSLMDFINHRKVTPEVGSRPSLFPSGSAGYTPLVRAVLDDIPPDSFKDAVRRSTKDIMLLMLVCVVRDRVDVIRLNLGLTSAFLSPFEIRIGLTATGITPPSGGSPSNLIQHVRQSCTRSLRAPADFQCLDRIANTVTLPSAMKSNDKWQDAIDVISVKCRRSGIMTYVLLAVFLVYLFGSIFVLRSKGIPISSINTSVGVSAGMVCALIVGYYLLQLVRWVKPPVWLP